MADLLRQGTQWLEQMRTAHCSSTVIYRRFGQADQQVNATYGKTDYEVTGDYTGGGAGGGGGATIRTHVIDFLILADDLGHEPKAGDAVVADGRKYEVMDLAGDGAWRWSDPYHTTFRIHTKDIGPPAPGIDT